MSLEAFVKQARHLVRSLSVLDKLIDQLSSGSKGQMIEEIKAQHEGTLPAAVQLELKVLELEGKRNTLTERIQHTLKTRKPISDNRELELLLKIKEELDKRITKAIAAHSRTKQQTEK